MSNTADYPAKLTISDLTDRIRNLQSAKAAAADPAVHGSPKDPREKGTASVPNDPEESNANSHLPPDAPNTESNEDKKLEDEQLHPVSTGKNVPSTESGDAQDAQATSPTTPLSKISAAEEVAERARKLTETMKGLMTKKEAAEEAAEEVAEEVAEEAQKEATEEYKNEEVANDFTVDEDFHIRLASALLADQEGRELAAQFLEKAAGAEAAREIMEGAAKAHDEYIKYANSQQEKQAAAEKIVPEFLKQSLAYELEQKALEEEIVKNASKEDIDQATKLASVHSSALERIEDPMLKIAYMTGAQDAAAMEDSPAGAEMIPGAGDAAGPASMEELAMILQDLVASGEITEEEAVQAMELLASEAGAGMDEAAMAGAEAPAELKEAAARAERLLA